MVSRLTAFLVWAAVAASVAFWGLRLLARPTAAPAQTLPVSLEQATRGDMLRLFPAPLRSAMAAIEPALVSRFKLVGVIAPRDDASRDGVALIAVDGKPPRAYHVGSRLDRDLVLQSVNQRGASIGPANGPTAGMLSAPTLPPPNIGSLPSAQSLLSNGEVNAAPSGLPPGGAPGVPPGMPMGAAPQPPTGQAPSAQPLPGPPGAPPTQP
jgi:general secretion pathway protein C